MMLLSVTALASLASLAACAASDKFASQATKHGGLLRLNSHGFDELLATPRNYSVSVVLTALSSQVNCVPCKVFDAELQAVAKGWSRRPERNEHFFASLDFQDGQDIFRRYGLQTAPTLKLFLPTDGPRASSKEPINYDFQRSGPSAEPFVAFVQQHTGLNLRFKRPPNYAAIVASLGGLVTFGTIAFFSWSYIKVVIFGRIVWAIGTIFICLLFTSGHMWNQIRTPPFVAAGPGGKPSLVAAGFQSQYGVETQIVMALYAVLAFSIYALAVHIPTIKDPARQRLALYTWLGIHLTGFGVLLALFRLKNAGFPFKRVTPWSDTANGRRFIF